MKNISVLPAGINKHLMNLCIPINKSRCLTIISAYALTLTCSDDTKEEFYKHLNQIKSSECLVCHNGGFQCKCRDTAYTQEEEVLGRYGRGIGEFNGNSLLLLSKCTEH